MQSLFNTEPAKPVTGPLHGFRLRVDLEPWLPTFLSNLADLFRRNPPALLISSRPGRYWADAQVHRPVAWRAMRQSFLAHVLAVVSVYGGSLWWLNRPRVMSEDPNKTTTILHYQLSEYLPEVNTRRANDEPPVRSRTQEADPEYSAQRIVSLHAEHNSTRQMIIQPDLKLLQHDVALPNLVTWSAVPGAAPVAARHSLEDLPASASPVIAPPQPTLERSASTLVFPTPPQPEVVAPATGVAHSAPPILAMNGPAVVPPAQDAMMRDPSLLQLPVQAPAQVAAPASEIASGHVLALVPGGEPTIVPPAQRAGQHRLNDPGLELPAHGATVVPPAQAVASGANEMEAREMGQLLALNARPIAPAGPVIVPEGNRNGEFAASPEGHAGASAAPKTRAGDDHAAGSPGSESRGNSVGPANIYVEAPPAKISGGAVVAAPRQPPGPTARTSLPDYGDSSPESIENQVFGGRRRYLLRLNMPNLTSAMGSWTIRFAELKADASAQGDISSPEPVRKVDPAYPASLLHDRVEGVVVLHAIIRSDGTVGDVRVLEGFNDELDANARNALEQWRFLPGLRNGIPVDVEAVVRVPFRVPRVGF
jgi:protein TonB